MVSLYFSNGYNLIALTELERLADLLPISSVELEHELLREFLDGSLCQHQRLVFQHRVHVQTIDRHDVHVGNCVGCQGDVLREEVAAANGRQKLVSRSSAPEPELTRQ